MNKNKMIFRNTKCKLVPIVAGFCIMTFGMIGCKKMDQTYYRYNNQAGAFNGNAIQYLRAQDGVYDSMLFAINRVSGLKDSIEAGEITLFAVSNASFTLALQNLNEVRTRFDPPRTRLYLATVDSAQLDTLLSRYVVKGLFSSDSISRFEDGLTVSTIRYDYEMQIQYKHLSSSGYEKGGPEYLIFSDRNNSIFERYWVSATTNAVDIKTGNSIVHVLSPGHDFGFGQMVERMNKK